MKNGPDHWPGGATAVPDSADAPLLGTSCNVNSALSKRLDTLARRTHSRRTQSGSDELRRVEATRNTSDQGRRRAEALNAQGHAVSHVLVAALLHELDFSLQANAKTIEGKQHPERDAQFRYINEQVRRYLRRGDPVISVDTKKKELVGPSKNGGREWQPVGQPERVKTHDFLDQELGKAIPYGVDDLRRNQGFVSVGTDHDTAAFAVHAVRTWWTSDGALAYPTTRRLLICADAGGSNGYRVRLWKVELARLAAEAGLAITVCHFPPGTSKWNTIEHRLFAAISTNWRGKPLTSHAVIVSRIGATTSRTGLSVRAELDPRRYPKGLKVSDEEMAALHLEPHSFHGDWNYTLRPGPPIRNTPKTV